MKDQDACTRSTGPRARWAKRLICAIAIAVAIGVLTKPGEAQLPEDLATGARSILLQMTRRTAPSPDARIAIIVISGRDQSVPLAKDLRNVLAAQWTSERRGTPVDDRAVRKALGKLLLATGDLLTREGSRQDFMRELNLQCLLLVTPTVSPDSVVLNSLAVAGTPPVTTEAVTALAKSDDIRAYFGEPIPGTLYVKAPSGTSVSVGTETIGKGGGKVIVARVPPGDHTLIFEEEGYETLAMPFFVKPNEKVRLAAKERNSAGAPLASLCASAVVPGLSLVMYGRPYSTQPGKSSPEIITGTGALIFYAGLACWGIDKLYAGENDFLTGQSRDRHRSIESVELLIAGAGYVVNLVGAFALGAEYAARNRQLTRDLFSSLPDAGPESMNSGLAAVSSPVSRRAPDTILSLTVHF